MRDALFEHQPKGIARRLLPARQRSGSGYATEAAEQHQRSVHASPPDDACGRLTHNRSLSPPDRSLLPRSLTTQRGAAETGSTQTQICMPYGSPAERRRAMQACPHAEAATVQDVGIDHRRAHVAMAQQLLHRANVVACLEQMGRKRMAKGVARRPLGNARRPTARAHSRATSSPDPCPPYPAAPPPPPARNPRPSPATSTPRAAADQTRTTASPRAAAPPACTPAPTSPPAASIPPADDRALSPAPPVTPALAAALTPRRTGTGARSPPDSASPPPRPDPPYPHPPARTETVRPPLPQPRLDDASNRTARTGAPTPRTLARSACCNGAPGSPAATAPAAGGRAKSPVRARPSSHSPSHPTRPPSHPRHPSHAPAIVPLRMTNAE